MELVTIFLLWLAITAIDNMTKRKKRRLPPPKNDSPDFEIPTLPGDPNSGEEIPIFIERPQSAEIQPLNTPPRPKKRPAQVREAEESNEFDLNLTPSKVLNAFVLTELLDKPKALRRRRLSVTP